ncbi:MAG: hypothetical protein OXT67_04465 [Zetaproteobacteria bacterium]|nr:hypothetical protein [Zetaproteobacteria bacterium]
MFFTDRLQWIVQLVLWGCWAYWYHFMEVDAFEVYLLLAGAMGINSACMGMSRECPGVSFLAFFFSFLSAGLVFKLRLFSTPVQVTFVVATGLLGLFFGQLQFRVNCKRRVLH